MRIYGFVLPGLLLFSAIALLSLTSVKSEEQRPATRRHPYHDRPSSEALPETLDASQFADQHASYVVYTLAARMKTTLYQVPCYCPCDRHWGHLSLLDCYRDRHGAFCPTCQKEILLCFRDDQRGKSPAQIRSEIAKGKAWKIDVEKVTNRIYEQLREDREQKFAPRL